MADDKDKTQTTQKDDKTPDPPPRDAIKSKQTPPTRRDDVAEYEQPKKSEGEKPKPFRD